LSRLNKMAWVFRYLKNCFGLDMYGYLCDERERLGNASTSDRSIRSVFYGPSIPGEKTLRLILGDCSISLPDNLEHSSSDHYLLESWRGFLISIEGSDHAKVFEKTFAEIGYFIEWLVDLMTTCREETVSEIRDYLDSSSYWNDLSQFIPENVFVDYQNKEGVSADAIIIMTVITFSYKALALYNIELALVAAGDDTSTGFKNKGILYSWIREKKMAHIFSDYLETLMKGMGYSSKAELGRAMSNSDDPDSYRRKFDRWMDGESMPSHQDITDILDCTVRGGETINDFEKSGWLTLYGGVLFVSRTHEDELGNYQLPQLYVSWMDDFDKKIKSGDFY